VLVLELGTHLDRVCVRWWCGGFLGYAGGSDRWGGASYVCVRAW
jgi:hypothetical protein